MPMPVGIVGRALGLQVYFGGKREILHGTGGDGGRSVAFARTQLTPKWFASRTNTMQKDARGRIHSSGATRNPLGKNTGRIQSAIIKTHCGRIVEWISFLRWTVTPFDQPRMEAKCLQKTLQAQVAAVEDGDLHFMRVGRKFPVAAVTRFQVDEQPWCFRHPNVHDPIFPDASASVE